MPTEKISRHNIRNQQYLYVNSIAQEYSCNGSNSEQWQVSNPFCGGISRRRQSHQTTTPPHRSHVCVCLWSTVIKLNFAIEFRGASKRSPTSEWLLADLELFEEVRQHLGERLIAHAAHHHVRDLVRASHDFLPRLVDVAKTLRLLNSSSKSFTTRFMISMK